MIVPPEGACTFHDPLNKCACCRAWQERVNDLLGQVTVAQRRERSALHLLRELQNTGTTWSRTQLEEAAND